MKKVNKKGFTLVEMLLAIAIMLLISGLFVSLIMSVRDSFYQVYNDDDSTDYATLYAQALENQLLYDAQNGFTGVYGINNDYIFTSISDSDNNQFSPDNNSFAELQNFNASRTQGTKWNIYMEASVDNKLNVVNYTFYLVDCYSKPNQNRLIQSHSGSIWLFSHSEEFMLEGVTTPSVKVIAPLGGVTSFTAVDKVGNSIEIHPVALELSQIVPDPKSE